MASKTVKATAQYPVSVITAGAQRPRFQRVNGGRWTVVVSADEAQGFLDVGGVSGIVKKDGTTSDVELTGEVHKTWTFSDEDYAALYTVPRESQAKGSGNGKAKGNGKGNGATVAADDTVAALMAQVAALTAQIGSLTTPVAEATPDPAPTSATTVSSAGAPTVRRSIKSRYPRRLQQAAWGESGDVIASVGAM